MLTALIKRKFGCIFAVSMGKLNGRRVRNLPITRCKQNLRSRSVEVTFIIRGSLLFVEEAQAITGDKMFA